MTEYKYNFNFILNLGATGISVDVKSNSKRVALQAPSGTGKTSFIKVIAGINKKYSGPSFQIHSRIGYVPQDSLLIPTMNVEKNLLLSPRSKKKDLAFICQELAITDLLHRIPRKLSGGEKQRVAIGRALLSNPQLLILDEPFVALDVEMRMRISNFLKTWIHDNNIDLLLVTHDEISSNFLCDEVWRIKESKLSISN